MSRVSYTTNTTIQPGIYCGGIAVSGSPTINFAQGIYYIAGGGFNFSGSRTICGTGDDLQHLGRQQ